MKALEQKRWGRCGLLAVFVLLCVLMGGCMAQTVSNNKQPEQQKTKIVFWNENAAADRTAYYQELIAQFERENPDIDVEYVGLPKKAARLKINTAIATNELPDVCGVQSAWIAEFYDKGVLLDLDDYFASWEGHDDILPSVIEGNRRLAGDGGLYQLPNTMGMEIMWYRPGMFAQAGLQPPETWDEFFAAALQLTDKSQNRYGYTIRGGDGASIQLLRDLFAYSGETQFFDSEGRCVLRQPVYADFLRRYLGLYRRATATSDITNGYQEMVAAFDNGQVAMMQHNMGSYGSHKRSLPADDFAPLLLPLSLRGTIVQEANNVDGYGIFKTTSHPEAAWRFVSFLCSAQVQSWWNEQIGQIPVSRKALQSGWVNTLPHMRMARNALESDRIRFYNPPMYLPEYRQILDSADRSIEQVMMGTETPEQFLADWSSQFENARAEYLKGHETAQ